MIAAVCCGHFLLTASAGWLAKGLAIAAVVLCIFTSVFLWREPTTGEGEDSDVDASTVPLGGQSASTTLYGNLPSHPGLITTS